MDQAQMDRFRRRLEAERADVNKRITESQASAEDSIDPDDPEIENRAAQSLLAEVELTMAERHTDRYGAIEAALRRIDDGEYGQCEECDDEIPIARLEIEPTATRCTSCQARHETQPNPTL